MPNRDFRGSFAGWPYLWDSREKSSLAQLFIFQSCALHMALFVGYFSRDNREIHLINFWNLILHRFLTLISYNYTHIHTGKMIKEIKIKFDMKLKPKQNIWKSQLYKCFHIYLKKKKKKPVYIHLLTWLHVTLNRHYGKKIVKYHYF